MRRIAAMIAAASLIAVGAAGAAAPAIGAPQHGKSSSTSSLDKR